MSVAAVLAGERSWTVEQADVLDGLRAMPSGSVNAVVTSPPYFGLRAYLADGHPDKPKEIGLEPTPAAYVARMVEVFREVRRVLRKDGTLWLNLGDSYCTRSVMRDGGNREQIKAMAGEVELPPWSDYAARGRARYSSRMPGLKDKDLIGMPWRVAFALQEDGWYLRSAITWCKRACMPECLASETRVFVRVDGLVRQVTLDDVLDAGEPYPDILTPTGWRPIQAAWEAVKDEAVAFEAAKVASVVCSREHLWPVSHDRRRVVTHEVRTDDLRDAGYADYLLHHTIDEWLPDEPRTAGGHDLDAELGWLLGLYAAEGGFGEVRGYRCKFTMHADETAVLDRAQEIVERRFGATVSRRTIKNYAEMRFSSAAWHCLAPRVVPGKSTTKALDLGVVLNAPREFRRGLWDGYLAGDGSARPAGVTATSASSALRDTVAVLASSIGIVTSKGEYRDLDQRTGRTYTGYQLWTPYLRHRQQKKASTARQITVRRKRIIPGPHRMIDLTVEGGLFLIEDGLITHNSVTDRPTSATEMVFLLTKSPRYWYDSEAVKEESVSDHPSGNGYARPERLSLGGRGQGAPRVPPENGKRNLRNFWLLGPEPFAGGHFGTFPTEIPRRAILAGCPPKACPVCGAPWRRLVEKKASGRMRDRAGGGLGVEHRRETHGLKPVGGGFQEGVTYTTLGWEPTCAHGLDPIGGVVLDCFSGASTTGLVAVRLDRRFIGLELNPSYVELSRRRIYGDAPLLNGAVADAPPASAAQGSLWSRSGCSGPGGEPDAAGG